MPTYRTIRFVESNAVISASNDRPFEVFSEDLQVFVPASTLVIGDHIRGAYGILTVSDVETQEVGIDPGVQVDPGERPYDDDDPYYDAGEGNGHVTARGLKVGDRLVHVHLGGFTVHAVDYPSLTVLFECGTRIAFSRLGGFTFEDGAPFELPSTPPRSPASFRATPKVQTLTVYHIPDPGWYEIPKLGVIDLTTLDPDTYITVSDDELDVVMHDGNHFRDRHHLVKAESPEGPSPSWLSRILAD